MLTATRQVCPWWLFRDKLVTGSSVLKLAMAVWCFAFILLKLAKKSLCKIFSWEQCFIRSPPPQAKDSLGCLPYFFLGFKTYHTLNILSACEELIMYMSLDEPTQWTDVMLLIWPMNDFTILLFSMFHTIIEFEAVTRWELSWDSAIALILDLLILHKLKRNKQHTKD